MKAVTKLIAGAMMCMAIAGTSFAAEMTLDQIFESTKLAVADLKATQPAHAEHIIGFKAWKSEDDARVIVYVKHDAMTMNINYLCHAHDGAPECHAQ